jgi:hypothetical protein
VLALPRVELQAFAQAGLCRGIWCDLLIVHQDVLERLMANIFGTFKPEVVGNDYVVLGTMERADWKRGLTTPLTTQEMLASLHDFKHYVRFKPGLWVCKVSLERVPQERGLAGSG